MIHRPRFERVEDATSPLTGHSIKVTCTECKDWSITQHEAGPAGHTKESVRDAYKRMHRANNLPHYWYGPDDSVRKQRLNPR